MIPETVYGSPLHPLVVHGVVVLIPLVAMAMIAMAFVPSLRLMLRWPTLLLGFGALVSTFIAASAGEDLQHKLIANGELSGLVAQKVQEHADSAGLLEWLVVPMMILIAVFVALDFKKAGRNLVLGTAALAVLFSGASVVQVVRTGHQGSSAVWNPGG